MKIKLTKAGKRYNREWIFRNADLEFVSGTAYAVTGHNGSGKSTLLQSIGGMLQLSEGKISYMAETTITPEEAYLHTSFCAPYLDVIEEMTLLEFLRFHKQFKPLLKGTTEKEIVALLGLEAAAHKQVRYYSSGMKQRVKLGQAIFSDTAIVLLDEPCSNLDEKGIELYHSLIATYCTNRIVIICSNDPVEYSFCKEVIPVTQFRENIKRNQPK